MLNIKRYCTVIFICYFFKSWRLFCSKIQSVWCKW